MPNFNSNYIDANGIKLHYYRTGNSKPPLVLTHGVTDDGLCWTRAAEALAADYDVIMVDARGHGKSEAPDEGYTMTDLVYDLAGFIQGLSLVRPILMGHSMGAVTILTLAGMFPDIPRAILLEDPPPFWCVGDFSFGNSEMQLYLVEWLNSNKRKTRSDLLSECHASSPNWTDIDIQTWIDAKHRYSPKIGPVVSPTDLVSLDYPNLLKRVNCPALFIGADSEKGSAAGESDIAVIQEAIQQLEVVHIAGAGHNIRRDQYDRFITAVNQFLAGLKDN